MTTGLVTRPIVSVTTAGATIPLIANVTCTLAHTEYSYVLGINCAGFIIQPRKGMGDLKISYTLGQSGTTYVSLPPNTFRAIGDILLTAPLTIYFQSTNAGTIVEIESWS